VVRPFFGCVAEVLAVLLMPVPLAVLLMAVPLAVLLMAVVFGVSETADLLALLSMPVDVKI